jgi:hypothetical protein
MELHQACQVEAWNCRGISGYGVQVLRFGLGGAAGAWLRLHLKRPHCLHALVLEGCAHDLHTGDELGHDWVDRSRNP